MKFGLNDTTIENIQTVFENNAKIDEVIVFGSRAKGNYKEGSNIDLAVKGSNISFDDILKLHGQVDDLNLAYKIDLLDYTTIKEPAIDLISIYISLQSIVTCNAFDFFWYKRDKKSKN